MRRASSSVTPGIPGSRGASHRAALSTVSVMAYLPVLIDGAHEQARRMPKPRQGCHGSRPIPPPYQSVLTHGDAREDDGARTYTGAPFEAWRRQFRLTVRVTPDELPVVDRAHAGAQEHPVR